MLRTAALFLALAPLTLFAEDSAPVRSDAQAMEARSLAYASLAMAPEVGADVVLRLLDSGKVKDLKDQRALLESVFRQAVRAQEPYPRIYLGRGMDNEIATLIFAMRLGLDVLSIQIRAVRQMLRIDPRTARDWFERISPQPPPVACRDAWAYDIRGYYELAELLLSRSFTPLERQKGDDAQFLRRLLGKVNSAPHLAPAARLIRLAPTPSRQRQEMAMILAGQLAGITGTDREFTGGESTQHFSVEIGQLASRLKADGESPIPLLAAYREFLARQMAQTRCEDFRLLPPNDASAPVDSIAYFNETLRSGNEQTLSVIATNPQGASKSEDRMTLRSLPDPERFSGLLAPLYEHQERPAVALDPEWREGAAAFLSRLEDWQDSSQFCPGCLFERKRMFYCTLIDVLPEGDLQRKAIASFIDFLARDPVQVESPIRWLSALDQLLRFTRCASASDQIRLEDIRKKGVVVSGSPKRDGASILEAMARSSNPAIALYARLEKIAPKEYELGL